MKNLLYGLLGIILLLVLFKLFIAIFVHVIGWVIFAIIIYCLYRFLKGLYDESKN